MSRLNKMMQGVGWGAVSTIVVTGFQLVFMGVMARLLQPADFGLVAIANVSLRFFQHFAQLGVQPAIIRKKTFDEGDARAALLVSLGIACLFFLLIFLSAPFFEYFFQMNGLTSIIRVLALNFIIGGFSAVSLGVMYRDTLFKSIAQMGVVSYIVGYGLFGLGAAFTGFGVWSLVIATLSQSLISAIWAYAATRHSVGFASLPEKKKYFFSFGGKYSIIGFMIVLTSSLGQIVAGKLLGVASAGLFSRAQLLANLPVEQPVGILSRTLFPIISSLRDADSQKQYDGLILSLLVVGIYTLSIAGGMMVAAPDIVRVLLGAQWLEAIPVLQILTMAAALTFITSPVTISINVLGDLNIPLKIHSTILISLVVFMVLLMPYGLPGIAWALVLAKAVNAVMYFSLLPLKFSMSLKHLRRLLLIYMAFALFPAGSIYLVMTLLPSSYPAVIKLIIEIMVGAVGMFMAFHLTRKLLFSFPAVGLLFERVPLLQRLLPRSLKI